MKNQIAVLAALVCASCATRERVPSQSPQAAVDELLAADRAFSAAGAKLDAINALSAMYADNIIVPVPGGTFADGKAAATEALRANPDNARSRVEWAPIRGGISADGTHGFTFGYMTQHRADSTRVPLKYLAYWVKTPAGWRVAGYRRRPRPEGAPPLAAMPPALPQRMVAAIQDASAIERHRTSVIAAEKAFSDLAQTAGLGPAFARNGSADAVNMGGPNDVGFVVGADAIAKLVSEGESGGSSVNWSADRALVASSGDLGITFGVIRQNGSNAAGFPFFTIWRRASVSQPWKYVAE